MKNTIDKIKQYIRLIRVPHWMKNLLILFPMIFNQELGKIDLVLDMIGAFIAFSLMASSIYIINDIRDMEYDRQHERKKNRPLASGTVSVKEAIVCCVVLILASIGINYIIDHSASGLLCLLAYLILNILYSLQLKNIPIVDVVILAMGFLIRVLYGGCILNIEISEWLYLTVLTMALYLGCGKRRNEVRKSGAKTSRKVLTYYSDEFLDKCMQMFLTLTIMFYAMWTISSKNTVLYGRKMLWTVVLVIMISMKYNMNIEQEGFGDPVDVVLKDHVLLFMILLYAVAMIFCIYI